MSEYLRQSTAATILAGPFVAQGDGITAKTGLSAPSGAASAASTGVSLIKNGVAASYTLSGWAHDRLGYYTVNLGSGDTDTLGRLKLVFIDPANFCPVELKWTVLAANVYDWLFGTSAPYTGTPPTTANIAAAILLTPANLLATDSSNRVTVGTNADKTGYSLSSTQTFNLTGNITGSVSGSVGSVTSGVTVTTNNDKTGYSLTVSPPTAAAIVTATWTALLASSDFSTVASIGKLLKDDINATISSRSDGTGVTLAASQTFNNTGTWTGDVSGSVGSVTAGVTVTTNNDKTGYSLTQTFPTNFDLLAIDGSGQITVGTNTDKTGYSLTVAPPTALETATAVWTDLLASGDFATPASVGALVLANLDATITSRLATVDYTGPLTGPDVAAAVLNATMSDYVAVNSVGAFIALAGTPDDIWGYDLSAYPSGTAGNAVFTSLDAAISSRSAPATPQTLDFETVLPTSPTSATVGEALKFADTRLDINVASRSTLDAAGVWTAGARTLTAAGLDAITIEAGINLRQALAPILASAAGVLSGAGTSAITVKNPAGDTTRVVASGLDGNGNRPSIALTLPA